MSNPYLIPYTDAVEMLGVSRHANQLAKRRAKYPGHIIELNGIIYMSRILFEALKEYHNALNYLSAIKKQEEVSHG